MSPLCCLTLTVFAQSQPPTPEQTAAAAGLGIATLLGFLCLGVVSLLFYFLPAFVAGLRGHQDTPAIFILTLLLGWTFLGWVAALVWSFTEVKRDRGR